MVFPNFDVQKSSSFLLLGESGSGKTTLLHLLGGLLKSQAGSIAIAGKDITELSEAQLDSFRAKNLGFIFQKNHLLTSLSVKQNLLMAPYLAGLDQRHERVVSILDELGLADRMNARIYELSQGQAQRVAIARALVNEPSVILADEPTSALDDNNCERVINLLIEITKRHGTTLLIATHDQRLKDKITSKITMHAKPEGLSI